MGEPAWKFQIINTDVDAPRLCLSQFIYNPQIGHRLRKFNSLKVSKVNRTLHVRFPSFCLLQVLLNVICFVVLWVVDFLRLLQVIIAHLSNYPPIARGHVEKQETNN